MKQMPAVELSEPPPAMLEISNVMIPTVWKKMRQWTRGVESTRVEPSRSPV